MAHAIALENAERSDICSLEYQDLLADHRDAMVRSIDAVLTASIVDDLPSLMRESVLPVFDTGDLESLTDALGDSLALLVEDQSDPERVALQGVFDLLHSRNILQEDHLLELARSLVADPKMTKGLAAFAGLAELPDNSGNALDSLLYASSQALLSDSAGPDQACMGLAEQRSVESLLSTKGFEDAPVVGVPIEIARVDDEGLVRDELYDLKKTAWAHGLRLAGEAVQAGVVTDFALVLDAALGQTEDCVQENRSNCYRYQSQGNPVYQLLFAGLEIARYQRPSELVETWSQLVSDNPALAEKVLVSVGAIIKALRTGEFDASSAEIYALLEELLPVAASVFRIDTRAGAMPRLLMDVIHQLSATAREFPGKLLLSVEHTRLIKTNECSSEAPQANSPKVDFHRKRFYFSGGERIDNRSALEQSIELLAISDCGRVPLTGGMTVGEAIVDLMSRLTTDTVCNLIDNLLGLLGFTGSFGDAVVDTTLVLIGCNGENDVRAADLFALDDLAKSGALDFYLPIAKTFRLEGEMRALVDIFHVMTRDLRSDEDSDAYTTSALRPVLPMLAEVLRVGAVDPFFDLNDLLVTVAAVKGDGTLADVVIDSADRLLNDRGSIETATGTQNGRSLAQELLDAAHSIALRIDDANRSDAVTRLFDHGSSYFTQTYTDDMGTSSTDDDQLRLRDSSIVPMMDSLLATATLASQLPPEQYQCYLRQWQQESERWVASPALASLVQVGVHLDSYSERDAIQDWIAGILDPERSDTLAPPFDSLLRVSAEILQTPVQVQGAAAVGDYISQLLYPSVQGRILVTTLAKVLSNDSMRVIQRLLAKGLGESGSAGSEAPFYKLAGLGLDYAAIDGVNSCMAREPLPESVAQLESSLKTLISFFQDQDSVLAGIYGLLLRRSGP